MDLNPAMWTVTTEEERDISTTLGMFVQLKAFTDRKSEVYAVRTKALAATLRRLRKEGAANPTGLPIDSQTRSVPRIAWRAALGPPDREPTWGLAASLLRRQIVDEVTASRLPR
jgi:hypothetical protein